jgi:hypothetical protein
MPLWPFVTHFTREIVVSNPFNKSSDKKEVDRMRRESSEHELRSVIERIIDDAQQKGMFENLPGKGKPLNLRKNPYAGDSALAFELLQNNDFTLPWIDKRNEILAAIEALRAELQEEWNDVQEKMQATSDEDRKRVLESEWQTYVRQFEVRLVRLNKKISQVNLSIPAERLEIIKLSLDKELERAGAR